MYLFIMLLYPSFRSMLVMVFAVVFLSPWWYAAWYDSCVLKTFKLTAYYSPIEWQKTYVMWSLEADRILNGNGTHWASWRAVFNGMIAAPKSYDFGSRIYIPGRWIWQVEDRWWAIVQAWERNEVYDRLDIRAGVGDVWLKKALAFGVKYYDAYVCPAWVGGDILGFDFSALPKGKKIASSFRDVTLSPWVTSKWVVVLQRYMMKYGFMQEETVGTVYDEKTKKAVCSYQQQVMHMNRDNERCGWFGERTKASLQQYIKELSSKENQQITTTDTSKLWSNNTLVDQVVSTTSIQQSSISNSSNIFIRKLAYNETWSEVTRLQNKLRVLWYYTESESSGTYDAFTLRAVYALQLAYKLHESLESPFDIGYLTPATRVVLNWL